MLGRLLLTVLIFWLLITFTPQLLAWGTHLLGIVLDHVHITLS